MTEQTFLGSKICLVKMHNLQSILLSLLHEKKLSRVQLAQKTSLSNATITNLITILIDQGIVTEEGTPSSNEPRSVGRLRTALRNRDNAYAYASVDFGQPAAQNPPL